MIQGLDDEEFAILEDLVGQNQIIEAKKVLGKAICARGSFIESAISLAENDIEGLVNGGGAIVSDNIAGNTIAGKVLFAGE